MVSVPWQNPMTEPTIALGSVLKVKNLEKQVINLWAFFVTCIIVSWVFLSFFPYGLISVFEIRFLILNVVEP